MKKVINKNRVRLVFPKYDLVLEPAEIKKITEEQFDGIIENIFIEEVLHESLEKEEKKIEDKNEEVITNDKSFIDNKGRKKKNY